MSISGTFPVPAPFATAEELTTVRVRFHDGTLPPAEWTWRVQLAIALGYTRAHGPADAARLMRDRWRYWLAVHTAAADARGGYHDTLIGFLLHIVCVYVAEHPTPPLDALDDLDELLAAWGDPELPLTHYSLAALFSDEARTTFIPPDLRPLPEPFGA